MEKKHSQPKTSTPSLRREALPRLDDADLPAVTGGGRLWTPSDEVTQPTGDTTPGTNP
jgi:hypothetical protein